ncbi:MAG: ankyrin repeat domain-containing protein [Parachlamydiaceae bacterium]|nr:ankyrin repeat domain-containing protein [Parachlamydiaceae bacterium]
MTALPGAIPESSILQEILYFNAPEPVFPLSLQSRTKAILENFQALQETLPTTTLASLEQSHVCDLLCLNHILSQVEDLPKDAKALVAEGMDAYKTKQALLALRNALSAERLIVLRESINEFIRLRLLDIVSGRSSYGTPLSASTVAQFNYDLKEEIHILEKIQRVSNALVTTPDRIDAFEKPNRSVLMCYATESDVIELLLHTTLDKGIRDFALWFWAGGYKYHGSNTTLSEEEQLVIVKTTLDLKADHKIRICKATPLHICSNPAVAEALIKAGADVNKKNRNGDTPLHFAVRSQQLKMVQTLLTAHAEPLTENEQGQTPLHIAIAKNLTSISLALIDAAKGTLSEQAFEQALSTATESTHLERVREALQKHSALETFIAEDNKPAPKLEGSGGCCVVS